MSAKHHVIILSALVGGVDAIGKSFLTGRDATGFSNEEENAIGTVKVSYIRLTSEKPLLIQLPRNFLSCSRIGLSNLVETLLSQTNHSGYVINSISYFVEGYN